VLVLAEESMCIRNIEVCLCKGQVVSVLQAWVLARFNSRLQEADALLHRAHLVRQLRKVIIYHEVEAIVEGQTRRHLTIQALQRALQQLLRLFQML
jgi:hypothetical protein